jgi:hypothetical protein
LSLRGLADSERAFLLVLKEREFEPFGQSSGGKFGRLTPAAMASTILGARKADRSNRRT